MIELVLSADDCARLKSNLVNGVKEKCAVLYATQTTRKDGTVRLLSREVQFADNSDYTRQGRDEAELTPNFVALVTKKARLEKLSLVFVHSHLDVDLPSFSAVDSRGEAHISAFLERRHPQVIHLAMVISQGGFRARRIGSSEDVRIISIGKNREVLFDPRHSLVSTSEIFDRQIRAFGKSGQEALEKLRIAVVGLGGTGSLVAQQLIHLGVRDFLLIDPDAVELTNLNRVANAVVDDVGLPKVAIAARYMRRVSGETAIACICGDVTNVETARELLNADIIFGCTDSHGSRAILQQISYQYMIPYIDMGVTITINNKRISHIYGRVQLLAPGLACFICDGLLNTEEVRRDMMSEFERQSDPYVQGMREPAPAVMSINGTVASLAVMMMLSMTVGIPMKGRHILFNAMLPSLRFAQAKPNLDCFICSRSGAYGRGDSWPLFARVK